jgi:hypothetical protein
MALHGNMMLVTMATGRLSRSCEADENVVGGADRLRAGRIRSANQACIRAHQDGERLDPESPS